MVDFDDEILIKDANGRFKILRGGKFYDLEESAAKPAAAVVLPLKLAEEILKKSGLAVEENLKTRLAEIIEAYQKDVRDKFETKNTLTRAVETGGMGFAPERADAVVRLMEVGSWKIEDGRRKMEVGEAAGKMAPATSVMPPGVAGFVFSPADEREILAQAQKMSVAAAGSKPVEAAKIIDEIIRESGVALDEINRKKLEKILLIHLKDIRDGLETKETLSRAAEPAGLVLAPEQVEKILAAARAKLREMGGKLKQEQIEKTKQAIEEEKLKQEAARQGVENIVKKKIDERWREMTKKSATPLSVPNELISLPIGLVVDGLKGLKVDDAKTQNIEPQRREEMDAKTQRAEIAKARRIEVTEKPKPLQIFKPVAPIRRPILPKEGKPRLEDIKYAPKLVGPIEELREMTLIDFRRLNSDPRAAVEKIKEKLSLLEKESVIKKIAGIKAWHESEVSRLYLEISRESLSAGAPASRVIAERTAAGAPALTMEEYQAAMELNRSLRY